MNHIDPAVIIPKIEELLAMCNNQPDNRLVEKIKDLVPEYAGQQLGNPVTCYPVKEP